MRLRAGNAIEKSKVRFLEYDFLTGIYGQQKFYQATRELLDQRAGANFAFIHFDIDRFRIINTLYGSKEGDRLIHFVAGAIRKVMTAYGRGTYGRLGDGYKRQAMWSTEESSEEFWQVISTAARKSRRLCRILIW